MFAGKVGGEKTLGNSIRRPPLRGLRKTHRDIMAQEYPRFSDTEMRNRRQLIDIWMDTHELEHVLVYGAWMSGPAVAYFTGWPVTVEAAVIFTRGHTPAMYIQFYNHLPECRQMAWDTEVLWGGERRTIPAVIETIKARGKPNPRIGVIGAMPLGAIQAIDECASALVDLNGAFFGARMIKSQEEIEWLRIGAALSDAGYQGLRKGIRLGHTERDLGNLVERAFMPHGGTNLIHFFGVSDMANPDTCVPRQWPLTREVRKGDVVFSEISANFWDYPGQILRTFTVGAEPTPLYRDLHDTADAAMDAIVAKLKPGTHASELVEASSMIEQNGFSTYDDLIHGFGGGYLPPVLGSKSRPAGPVPDITLQPNMCLVVQPNVITTDEKAGVQTGDTFRITEIGCESLHNVARGLDRIDPQ
jgi:Xaa-Pro aminopeptidase